MKYEGGKIAVPRRESAAFTQPISTTQGSSWGGLGLWALLRQEKESQFYTFTQVFWVHCLSSQKKISGEDKQVK